VPKKLDNPELHVDLMFPSRYLKAVDLQGKEAAVVIAGVKSDQVQMTNGRKEAKYIVIFEGTDKELILNKTNAKAIARVLGEPKAVKWAGAKITLKPAKCEAFGEIVDCIRIKED
jgi:hypothetical protein